AIPTPLHLMALVHRGLALLATTVLVAMGIIRFPKLTQEFHRDMRQLRKRPQKRVSRYKLRVKQKLIF
ncbi:MAG: hypothetical protein DRP56_07165, partial [Planctomycetota bacterium]